MDPILLMKKVQDALQQTADILSIDYPSATPTEQTLIQEMCSLPTHQVEWFLAIKPWNGGRHL